MDVTVSTISREPSHGELPDMGLICGYVAFVVTGVGHCRLECTQVLPAKSIGGGSFAVGRARIHGSPRH